MNDKIFINQLKAHSRELHQLMYRWLSILIGRMAKNGQFDIRYKIEKDNGMR